MSLSECWNQHGPCVVTDLNQPQDIYPPMALIAGDSARLRVLHAPSWHDLRLAGLPDGQREQWIARNYIGNTDYVLMEPP